MSQEIQTYAFESSGQEARIFGYHIPYIPDFIADHTLLGETPSDRLEEILQRFQRLVAGLRKHHGTAFSFRIISRPDAGAVDLYFLGRVLAPKKEITSRVQQVSDGISIHLATYGIPHKLLGIHNEPSVMQVIQPFTSPVAVVEIRQHEMVVPLVTVKGEAYVIHPYTSPTGSFLEPYETLLRQPSPVLINVYLEPTEITTEEAYKIAEAAQIAQTFSDLDFKSFHNTGIHRQRDPGAELVAKIYSEYSKSLNEPFILTVQAASPDPNSAWIAARTYASGLIHQRSSQYTSNGAQIIPSAADLVVPPNQDEQHRYYLTLYNMIWYPRSEIQATEGKERLPYLVGAEAAASAFRFPVSVKGGIPGISVRQLPPDFEPGPRPNETSPEEIYLGVYQRGGKATIPIKDLTRHALITGFTGSGKTNTVLYLLDQLWKTHKIPFLVIEAAKKEYRALAQVNGMTDLLVFTIGDETTSPFRLNPFEILPGVRCEAHLNKLQVCFDAALPQFGILPSIVAEAMERIYRARNWNLTDHCEINNKRLFPTLRDLYRSVIQVAENRGYAGETYYNIRAAASGRIGNLLRGSRGMTFGGMRSYPAEIIFGRPVILELNDLNEEDKALVMMFLLTWLREYRELHRGNILQHVTVVEEAHNVLSNVQSVGASVISADTKAKSVATFSNMLSEIRAYGEGLIISDQSPEKLAPDAIRNTNLQIAHQLRDRKDREAIARAMIMDEAQQEYLGKLRIGEAAFFRTGIEKATFITVPEYKDSAGFNQIPGDQFIRQLMSDFQKANLINTLPYDGCKFCGNPCLYREYIEPQTFDQETHERFIKAIKLFEENPQQENWIKNWREVAKVCNSAAQLAGVPNEIDAAYCYLSHEIDFEFTQHMRREFEKAFDAVQ